VLSPSPAAFGTVNINTSKTQIISVKNSTKTAATIGSFVASDDTGSPAPAFSVIPAGTTCVAGASIAGGSSCNIAVQFRPTKTGAYAGKLTLTDSLQRTTVDALGGTGR
jgi:hypothetical protein